MNMLARIATGTRMTQEDAVAGGLALRALRPAPLRAEAADAFLRLGEITHVQRGTEIIAQDDEVEWCYRIVSGCVRSVRLIEDGRRQIGAFFLEGDTFGWDAIGVHDFAAEAVTGVRMRRLRVHALEDRALHDLAFARELHLRLADRIRLTHQHVVLLGRRTASERIASFLIDMRQRLRTGPDGAFALPMCRVDIADYLGLTIETVSRRLTKLDRGGVIKLAHGRIAICDEDRLAVF